VFEVPRKSLMDAVQWRIFDDLLIGNFMKTTLTVARIRRVVELAISVAIRRQPSSFGYRDLAHGSAPAVSSKRRLPRRGTVGFAVSVPVAR
jgi:hypothetical protein